jgi:hypothetical protein
MASYLDTNLYTVSTKISYAMMPRMEYFMDTLLSKCFEIRSGIIPRSSS